MDSRSPLYLACARLLDAESSEEMLEAVTAIREAMHAIEEAEKPRPIAEPVAVVDRQGLIAATLLECPVKHFTTSEIGAYLRERLADLYPNELEIDAVLTGLKTVHRLTVRGGLWSLT